MALSNLIWWPWFGLGTPAPVTPDYNPVGKPTAGRLDGPPVRRGRRRELEDIFNEDEELIAVLMDEV